MTNDNQKSEFFLVTIVKFFWRLLRAYFVFVGIMVTVVPILIVLALRSPQSSAPLKKYSLTDADKAVLVLEATGSISERSPDARGRFFARFFGGEEPLYLPDVRAKLRAAKVDDRIRALHLHIHSLLASQAAISEFAQLLKDFKSSGKPINTYLVDGDDKAYLLAVNTDFITLEPAASLDIPGPVFNLMFFADALKKIGVEFQLFRAGKYKSAFEPLVRNEPSAETQEMYGAMERTLRTHLATQIAEGRKVPVAKAMGWLNHSMFTAKEALAEKLIDRIGFEEDSIRQISDFSGAQKTLKFEKYDGVAHDPTEKKDHKRENKDEGIALIEAVGDIVMMSSGASDDSIAPRLMLKELEWARTDPDVKAVVLRVSSPGGSAIASDVIWRGVADLKKDKPVIVSMGSVAASGGYYISAGATRILAQPTTITGSIGVIGGMPKLTGIREKFGVSFFTISQSERKKLFDPASKPTAEDLKIVGATIDETYQTFLKRVADGRKMTVEQVDKIAQGRVYTGIEALKLGLVDELGGMQEAFRAAKIAGGLDPEQLYPVLSYEGEDMSFAECLRHGNVMGCIDELDLKVDVPGMISQASRRGNSIVTMEEDLKRRLGRIFETAYHERALAYLPMFEL